MALIEFDGTSVDEVEVSKERHKRRIGPLTSNFDDGNRATDLTRKSRKRVFILTEEKIYFTIMHMKWKQSVILTDTRRRRTCYGLFGIEYLTH
ncbi:hypothetical protein CHS0354_034291 [Potamilus streckersoni]|uniref:Uncharacterized protein n=1 Tax=Potamilus streckersoni TaxID=2493646 RepID=A0AAE0TC35_9BIVA|nr:hypothetical protein CHS0354_034291 [Potamilus streckersoni]